MANTYLMAAGIAGIAAFYAPQALAEPAVGQKVPEILGQDLNGKRISLEKYIGKGPVVINFFETWCQPCKLEMPSLNAFSQAYKGKVTVVGLTMDRKRDTKYYMEQNKYDPHINVILLDSGLDHAAVFPTTYVIDKKGMVVLKSGFSMDFLDEKKPLRQTIDGLLAKKKKS